MFGITIYTKNAETPQPIKGFKGVSVFFDRKQTIAVATGFKGFTVQLIAPGGGAVKISHRR